MEQQQTQTDGDAPSGARTGEPSSFFDTHFGRGASASAVRFDDDGGLNESRTSSELGQQESSSHGQGPGCSRNSVPLPPHPQLLPQSLLQAPTATTATPPVSFGGSFFVRHFRSAGAPEGAGSVPTTDGPATPPALPAKRPAPRNDAGAPSPAPVPEGRAVRSRSWCCGRLKQSAGIWLCSHNNCPRWRCGTHTRQSADQGDFTCCTHKPELKQGCQCHA